MAEKAKVAYYVISLTFWPNVGDGLSAAHTFCPHFVITKLL